MGHPDLEAGRTVGLVEELSHPGVGLGDGEAPDLRVGERLDVGVAEHGVHTDLAGELGEPTAGARGNERR